MTAANLGRDLLPNGEARFPFIPFRYGTSLGTCRCESRWGGHRPPQRLGFLRCAHRLRHCGGEGVEHRDSHPGTIRSLRRSDSRGFQRRRHLVLCNLRQGAACRPFRHYQLPFRETGPVPHDEGQLRSKECLSFSHRAEVQSPLPVQDGRSGRTRQDFSSRQKRFYKRLWTRRATVEKLGCYYPFARRF
jgi:hypothetical protein